MYKDIANKAEIAKRLREFGKRNFKSFRELARKMEWTPQALNAYLSGQSIPGGNILFKLKELGCDINWLLSEDNDTRYVSFRKVDEIGIIPNKFEYKMSNSVPSIENELNIENEWVEKELINFDPATHVFLKIDENNGKSMVPLLQPGDVVLLDILSNPQDGDLVAARWDDSCGMVKILNIDEQDPERVMLLSFNSMEKPIIKNRQNIKIYKIVMIRKNSRAN
jgi:phage repressor protein C with HTH and peptisase S24 domain